MKFLSALLTLCLCAALLHAHEETQTLSLSSSGIDTLEIESGAGFLKVEGKDRATSIDITAEIILKGRSEDRAQEFMNRHMRLELRKRGRRAVLVAQFRNRSPLSAFSFKTAVINLTVRVPEGLRLDIEDGSGAMNISNLAGPLTIDDGSGDIEIKDIRGAVRIEDGSGSIEVRDVRGEVTIDDGSGSILVENVTEDVRIDDGSGSITVNSVGGDFILEDDGSGSLRVNDVKGRVRK